MASVPPPPPPPPPPSHISGTPRRNIVSFRQPTAVSSAETAAGPLLEPPATMATVVLSGGHGGYGRLAVGSDKQCSGLHYTPAPWDHSAYGTAKQRAASLATQPSIGGAAELLAQALQNGLRSMKKTADNSPAVVTDSAKGPGCSDAGAVISTAANLGGAASANVALDAWVAVACGAGHNVAVTKAGRVYTAGKCHFGQLGHGEVDQDEWVWREITALCGIAIQSVAAGCSHVLAVEAASGRAYAWGCGYYGALGMGNEKTQPLPRPVSSLEGVPIAAVAGGEAHSVFLARDTGHVYVCGRNVEGQLGIGAACGNQSCAVRVDRKDPAPWGSSVVVQVAAGASHTAVLCNDGDVWAAGSLLSETDAQKSGTFQRFAALKNIVAISSAFATLVALDREGHVWVSKCARGKGGTAGTATTDTASTVCIHHTASSTDGHGDIPQALPPMVRVAAGYGHQLFVDADGALWVRGQDAFGQCLFGRPRGYLADATRSDVLTAEVLASMNAEIISFAGGNNHSLVCLAPKPGCHQKALAMDWLPPCNGQCRSRA